jgi:hypothetical protein
VVRSEQREQGQDRLPRGSGSTHDASLLSQYCTRLALPVKL